MAQTRTRRPTKPAGGVHSQKRVLNAGSGPNTPSRLHPLFRSGLWHEVRMDIDQAVQPDLIGSITDLSQIPDSSFDAVWCSHSLEHLYRHEVGVALRNFRRVLATDGFALITCPDLESIAELIVDGRLEATAYQSPAGPISALEMLYGHAPSIERGHLFMAHHTGFTADRMGRLLLEAGFSEAFVTTGSAFDLWALALAPHAAKEELQHRLHATGLDFYE